MHVFNKGIRGLLLLIFGALPLQNFGQTAEPDPLDRYIQEGLKSNLTLKQKNIGLDKAAQALRVANTYFLPQLAFGAAYTHGEGGRNIALPIGDMLNPVYSTLNQLTDSENFPQIENVNQTFFPQNFYDAHVRTSMPLLNTDLHHNKRIQQSRVLLQEWEVKAYERELVKNIKQAYYAYGSALEAVKIWESALSLVQQNLEVNESLLRNGKGLPAQVLRAQSELEGVKSQLQEAQNGVKNAQRYFNFLLNKPQEAPIESAAAPEETLADVSLMLQQPAGQVSSREELQMLQTGEQIQQTVLRMRQQKWVPQVGAFIDLGAQADNMRFNSQAPYLLLGVSLDVPLFSGFRNRYETRQAQLEVQEMQLSLDQTAQQLQMASAVAYNNLGTAYQNYGAARQRLTSAEAYFRLLERGYKEGTNSLIEFIDARNQLTQAQLQLNLNTYQVLSALAQYEREINAYPIHE